MLFIVLYTKETLSHRYIYHIHIDDKEMYTLIGEKKAKKKKKIPSNYFSRFVFVRLDERRSTRV